MILPLQSTLVWIKNHLIREKDTIEEVDVVLVPGHHDAYNSKDLPSLVKQGY